MQETDGVGRSGVLREVSQCGVLHLATTSTQVTWPGPSRRRCLFASLSTAGLSQNSLPLDVGFVVGVDGGVDVKSVLQVLASASVDHGPLFQLYQQPPGV